MGRQESKTEIINGTAYTYYVDGTKGPRTWEEWYRCSQCSFNYPRSKTRFFRGKAYGVPCGCYKDIYGIRMREREETRRARKQKVG